MTNFRLVPVKCVKESVVIESDDEVTVLHYNTVILRLRKNQNHFGKYDIISIYRASVTSSKMINRVLDYYGVEKPSKKDEIYFSNYNNTT